MIDTKYKNEDKITWSILFIVLACVVFFFSKPVFNKDSTYTNFGGCNFIIESRGVKLATFSDFSGISVDKPSILNNLIHFDISWPLSHGLGEKWRKEGFEFRFVNLKNGIVSIQLEMFGSSTSCANIEVELLKNRIKRNRDSCFINWVLYLFFC